MALWDRVKKIGSTQPEIKVDPCEDQSFSPRYKERKINVFVSSTFKDMIGERDELTLRIFPALRKVCEGRGIAWGEVDLRWGIPEEKKGEVLSTCLKFIDECRPYFIGMLGERYGWVDETVPDVIIKDYPWITDHKGKSITELEILHGVLNNPAMAGHAYFYFRDPEYIRTLPASQREDLIEGPTEEEIEDYGFEEASKRADHRKDLLVTLKKMIRESNLPIRENYRDPVQFGELVREDLLRVIDSVASAPKSLSEAERTIAALDREDMAHEAFAASRFGVYIPRQEYFDRLDAHATGDGPPLVVLGESGSGKSALLAHWAFRYRLRHPDDLVLVHFVGASSESTDWASMLRRFMGEFKRKFSLTEEIPAQDDALLAAFGNWFSMAAAHGRIVMVIDALNQLEDRNGAPDLVWLPPKIPENIRLFISTLPGRPLDAIRKREWPEMTVEPLTVSERDTLITCYLKKYHKELSPPVREELASAPQGYNPLFLRALMEEIRTHGVFEKLAGQIKDYLSAHTVNELYEMILARYERDYERDRPGLVKDTASLLWAARRGLSKPELMDLLGKGGKPLPDAYWAPLYLAMEHSLVEKDGRLAFFHDYLRAAVEHRYLPGVEQKRAVHVRIANYFDKQPEGMRRTEELPWQLAESAEWDKLVALLINSSFFIQSYQHFEFDIKRYWVKIENNSAHKMVEQYGKRYQNEKMDYIVYLCSLLYDNGHVNEVESLHKILIPYCRKHQLLDKLQGFLGNQALIRFHKGDVEAPLNLLKEQESICLKLGDINGVQRSLGNQSTIYYAIKNYNLSLELLNKKEQICRDSEIFDGLAYSLGKQAIIFYEKQGHVDEAIQKFKEEEDILRFNGNISGLASCLGNQAIILLDRKEYPKCLNLLIEQERILQDLGNYKSLIPILNTHAVLLMRQEKYEMALDVLGKMNFYSTETGYIKGQSYSLLNQAICLCKLHKYKDALSTIEKSYQIAFHHNLLGLMDKIIPYKEKIRHKIERK